ncbi:hypothetical protein NDU88_002461 [Pleurodeles waltl]|uniref:Uncharacterized protein n=1 Tax=Pleurodeles waltl TaxID=8319 RepID=A0AAV7WLI4_PLEWA|nr:hypothetical protein NDU88_002461 [Pleurodeles waltl]
MRASPRHAVMSGAYWDVQSSVCGRAQNAAHCQEQLTKKEGSMRHGRRRFVYEPSYRKLALAGRLAQRRNANTPRPEQSSRPRLPQC